MTARPADQAVTTTNPYQPGDLRHTFCALVDALCVASHVRSEMEEAAHFDRAARACCGNCTLWMTRGCPRERNVNGRNHGPSMNGPACDLFAENSTVQGYRDLAEQHRAKALELTNAGGGA